MISLLPICRCYRGLSVSIAYSRLVFDLCPIYMLCVVITSLCPIISVSPSAQVKQSQGPGHGLQWQGLQVHAELEQARMLLRIALAVHTLVGDAPSSLDGSGCAFLHFDLIGGSSCGGAVVDGILSACCVSAIVEVLVMVRRDRLAENRLHSDLVVLDIGFGLALSRDLWRCAACWMGKVSAIKSWLMC